MKKKTSKLLIALTLLLIISAFSFLVSYGTKVTTEEPTSHANHFGDDTFSNSIAKPAWVDRDDNAIADILDQEIADRTSNDTAQNQANVTITLKNIPTIQDAEDFISSGGFLTTQAWTEATYGFGGMIPYAAILNFTRKCSNVFLVEEEAIGETAVSYAAQQVGARTYVWETLGLQGDPNSSIAIMDTGIDGSNTNFAPGYGDQDFSKKIVGWRDTVGGTTSTSDDNGHGSHVAGLAAGDGFFSVDASGYATATWGQNLGSISSSAWLFGCGLMVNRIGTISINIKWTCTGTAKLSEARIDYGDKTLSTGSWSTVTAVNTPNPNTFYTLTYDLASTPTDGPDIYHVFLRTTAGSGNLYAAFTMSWPYLPPSDGFSAWTGIAPQSKLVGVKVIDSTGSGTSNRLISGINWIISNKLSYHITVVSMSIGFDSEISAIDIAVQNLVNNGITTIVAAGNEGSGANRIYTPASVDEVITVAAMNQFDSITSYSSQGGTSGYTGATMKPDITAPGGSHYAAALFSTDSNYNDAEGGFPDIQANDSAPMQGTSMSAPVIAGCAQIVVQAMGGFSNWNYTKKQALQPKMFLLMTASETYPNRRETGAPSTSPTLERGGKDVHEGSGRVNLDAAVDAIMKSYEVGNNVTDSLGRPPTITDNSVVGQKTVWARNVQLISGEKYNFTLSVPEGADYDLYIYDNKGNAYGEPTIVAKSTNPTIGGTEQFWVTATYTGTYYIVIKRATETTVGGTFTLSSATTVQVTLYTPGLPNASDVVHYTKNGIQMTGSIVASTFLDTVDSSTTLTIDNPVYVSSKQRYITNDSTFFTIQSSSNLTINYNTQYHISVNSSHNTPTPSQWVDQGGSFTASVTSPAEVVADNNRWICTGYSLNGNSSQPISSYTFDNVRAPQTIEFNWKQQFYFKVNSPYESPTGQGWYDEGATIEATLPSGIVSGGTGVQYVFTGWSGDASGTELTSNRIDMSRAKIATANWKNQYYLTLTTLYGNASGEGWYDSGTLASATITPLLLSGPEGTRYIFVNWAGDASGDTSPSNPIVMNNPKFVTANWKTQYLVSITVNPQNAGSTNPDGANVWTDSGSEIISAASNIGFSFSQWSSNVSSISYLNALSSTTTAHIEGPGTISANFQESTTPVPLPTLTPILSFTPSPPPPTLSPSKLPTPPPTPSNFPSLSPTHSPSPSPTIPEMSTISLILALVIVVGISIIYNRKKRPNGKG
jgi:subtilisin family serine protease